LLTSFVAVINHVIPLPEITMSHETPLDFAITLY